MPVNETIDPDERIYAGDQGKTKLSSDWLPYSEPYLPPVPQKKKDVINEIQEGDPYVVVLGLALVVRQALREAQEDQGEALQRVEGVMTQTVELFTSRAYKRALTKAVSLFLPMPDGGLATGVDLHAYLQRSQYAISSKLREIVRLTTHDWPWFSGQRPTDKVHQAWRSLSRLIVVVARAVGYMPISGTIRYGFEVGTLVNAQAALDSIQFAVRSMFAPRRGTEGAIWRDTRLWWQRICVRFPIHYRRGHTQTIASTQLYDDQRTGYTPKKYAERMRQLAADIRRGLGQDPDEHPRSYDREDAGFLSDEFHPEDYH